MAAAVETLTVKVTVKVDINSVAQFGGAVVNVDHAGVALAGVTSVVAITDSHTSLVA